MPPIRVLQMSGTVDKKRGEIRVQSTVIMPKHVELKLIEERDALPNHVPLRHPFEKQLTQNRRHSCSGKPMSGDKQKKGGKFERRNRGAATAIFLDAPANHRLEFFELCRVGRLGGAPRVGEEEGSRARNGPRI